jgi:hypothetical protein
VVWCREYGERQLIVCAVDLTNLFKADARRVPVAHRTPESSVLVCVSDTNEEIFSPRYSVN